MVLLGAGKEKLPFRGSEEKALKVTQGCQAQVALEYIYQPTVMQRKSQSYVLKTFIAFKTRRHVLRASGCNRKVTNQPQSPPDTRVRGADLVAPPASFWKEALLSRRQASGLDCGLCRPPVGQAQL